MAGGVLLYLWNEWSIQILVLLSLTLQVVLFLFAGMRQCNSRVWKLLLWLAYLLADSTAIYSLAHIANSKSPELRLPAFWAQFLLLHLGGQDTMTAYALEDNQLWLRHLLTLVLQALGAAYVLYRHTEGSGVSLVMASVLIFLLGTAKYGERVWTLKFSSHDGITNFFDYVELDGCHYGDPVDDDEEVLQQAHDLLGIFMGQFVDLKIGPSSYQQDAINCMNDEILFKLIGMQLSVMHDILYTKAIVIHTWYGCCSRAVSLVAMVTALLLFRFKTHKEDGYRRADVAVTYTLLAGAIVLEMASILRAIGSSWTCTIWRARKWDKLHGAVKYFRRLFKSAQRGRRWSGSIGQHKLLGLCIIDYNSLISRTWLKKWLNKLCRTSTIVIPDQVKQLVLEEIRRMVHACQGKEDMMWSYRGQCVLNQWDGFREDPTGWCVEVDFDESILAWHFATNVFFWDKMEEINSAATSSQPWLAHAIEILSNYMMFLLVEHPYMLPSPIRARRYHLASKCVQQLLNRRNYVFYEAALMHTAATSPSDYYDDRPQLIVQFIRNGLVDSDNKAFFGPVLIRGATLARRLLLSSSESDLMQALRIIFGVWVEMLCYAASHCSRDSHARQLNSGPEFITLVWILATSVSNCYTS